MRARESGITESSGKATDKLPDELAQLFSERRLKLVRLAYLMTSDASAAEEIVQDAFVRVSKHWAQLENPQAYIRAAVVNGARSWGRHQQVVDRHIPERPSPVLLEPDELWDALATLTDRQRIAIVLRYYDRLSTPEIAHVLDCSPITVRTSIHRGLKRLKQEIE